MEILATYTNPVDGLETVVHKSAIRPGTVSVTFRDTDAAETVETRIYPDSREAEAHDYAKGLVVYIPW